MEGLFALLRVVLENVWRLGVLCLISGATVVIADRWQLPSPDVLKGWIGWASFAVLLGVALILMSAFSALVDGLHHMVVERRAKRRNAEALEHSGREAVANIQTLTPNQRRLLLSSLQASPSRFEAKGYDRDAEVLIRKKVLTVVGTGSRGNWLCEVHPVIVRDKAQLTQMLQSSFATPPR